MRFEFERALPANTELDLSTLVRFLMRQDKSGRHRPAGTPSEVLPELSISDDRTVIPDDHISDRHNERQHQRRIEGTGSPEQNGRRLMDAMRNAPPGTTIVLGAGEFRLPKGRVQLRGREGAPIQIVGSGERTKLTGGSDNAVLHIENSNNFSIQNLSIEGRNSLHDLRITDSRNIHISNNVFRGTRPRSGDDNSSIQFGGECQNVRIEKNLIHATGGRNSKTHCIYFGEGNRRTKNCSSNIVVANNEMHYFGPECGAMVQFNSNGLRPHENVRVQNNSFRSHSFNSKDYGGGGIALAGIRNVLITGNDMNIARGAFIEVWGQGVDSALISRNNFQLTGAPRSRPQFVISGPYRRVAMHQGDNQRRVHS